MQLPNFLAQAGNALAKRGVNFTGYPPSDGPGTGLISFGFGLDPRMVVVLRFVITVAFAAHFRWRSTNPTAPLPLAQFTIALAALFLSGCAISGKTSAIKEAMQRIDAGELPGMDEKTDFIYSIPPSHRGPYSAIDSVNLTYHQPEAKTSGNITLFVGKSRETGEWKVFHTMLVGKQTALKWKSVPFPAIAPDP